MNLLSRRHLLELIETRFRSNPVVLLTGPRQCGKSTLARQYAGTRESVYFDLENPEDARRLSAPMTALRELRGLVVIDEAQLLPALFPILRVLADRPETPAQFLLSGSASPELISGSAESLAGRVANIPMGGFDLGEVGTADMRRLWWRGGFPRSFLAGSDAESAQWRDDFIQTFLERDLGKFGVRVPAPAMRRFWNMAAHYHGQTWNGAAIANSLGETSATMKRRLDVLCGALVMRQLPPWFENISKRQVKSPKVYLRDSGLLHGLLGISNFPALESHPKLGASWEGFALEETLRVTGDRDAYFWATQSGAELDLLVFFKGKRLGFEFKYADAPGRTHSMTIAHADLKLDKLFVIYPGTSCYALSDWCEAVPLTQLSERLSSL